MYRFYTTVKHMAGHRTSKWIFIKSDISCYITSIQISNWNLYIQRLCWLPYISITSNASYYRMFWFILYGLLICHVLSAFSWNNYGVYGHLPSSSRRPNLIHPIRVKWKSIFWTFNIFSIVFLQKIKTRPSFMIILFS